MDIVVEEEGEVATGKNSWGGEQGWRAEAEVEAAEAKAQAGEAEQEEGTGKPGRPYCKQNSLGHEYVDQAEAQATPSLLSMSTGSGGGWCLWTEGEKMAQA